MTGIRCFLAAAIVAAATTSASAQLPQTRITSVFPAGGQQGASVDLTVGGGTDLDELDQMVFSHPGITAVQKADANGNPVANTFTVTVAADVTPGLYDVRVRGLFGISNPRMFRVDSLPEIVEIEPNNVIAQATPVALGSVVNGRANGATDVDFFKVPLAAGQTIVVRSETGRLDSPMQPLLQLFSPAGRRLAESRRVFTQEASLVYTAAQAEELVLRVQDIVYSGGDQFVYRLSFDSRPMVDWISPSFVMADAPTAVTIFGRHLPGGQPTDKTLGGQPVFQQQITIAPADGRAPVGASATAAFADSFWWGGVEGNLVRVGRAPLAAVAEAVDTPDLVVPAPFEANGSFAERSDEDIYRFDAKKGESWVVEVFAQRLGSNADPLLMVERVVTAADGAVTYARLATEDDDKQNPGGADLPTLGDDPSFRLDVPEDGTYRIRLRDRYADTRGDSRLGYRLSVRAPKPDFSLVVFDAFPSADGKAPVTSGAVSLRKGSSYELTVYAYRRDGHAEAIQLTAEGLPAGITCRPTTIGPGQVSAKLIVTAAADAAEQLTPIRVIGRSGAAEAALQRDAKVATLVYDAINGLPRTARLAETLVAGVMKDEQPFSIIVDPATIDYSQDQQWLVPVRIVKRGGFDAKVDLSVYGLPAEVDAPPVAIEPGKDSVVARIYFKENAPASTSTIFVQGTSAVPYRRNPWQAERAMVKVTEAEAAVVARQEGVTKADAGLKAAQVLVVTLNEQVKKITDELATYVAQSQKLAEEYVKSLVEQKASVEALSVIQTQLAAIKTDAASTPEQLDAALLALKEAAAATAVAAAKVETLSSAAAAIAKQVAASKEMETTKTREKVTAEEEVVKRTKEVETAQVALTAAQKEVETATAAKTAADAVFKTANDAAQPKPLNVRVVSEPMVVTIHPSPAKIAAAVPDAGVVKRGAMMAVKVTVTRKNNFAGVMKLTLVLPDGVAGVTAAAVDVPADQAEGTLMIAAAADAPVGDIVNAVIRATGDFSGRAASTDVPVVLKVVE
jgi:hypothetical protein